MPANPGFQRVDALTDIIRGPARIIVAPQTVAFPTTLAQIINVNPAGVYTQDVQTITTTGTPTGGTFTLTFMSQTTAPIPWNASSVQVAAALNALGSVSAVGGVTATGGPLPTAVVVTFGNNGLQPVLAANATALTGGTTPTVAVAHTTSGNGLYDITPGSGWIEMGSTRGGVNVARNNTETVLDIDQVFGAIATVPDDWEMTIAVPFANITFATLQVAWELGAITVDSTQTPTESHMGMSAPTAYVSRRLAVLHQKAIGNTAGRIRAKVFRIVNRSPQNEQLDYAKTGPQQTLTHTFRALADTNVTNPDLRFGDVIEQNIN